MQEQSTEYQPPAAALPPDVLRVTRQWSGGVDYISGAAAAAGGAQVTLKAYYKKGD